MKTKRIKAVLFVHDPLESGVPPFEGYYILRTDVPALVEQMAQAYWEKVRNTVPQTVEQCMAYALKRAGIVAAKGRAGK